MRASSLSVVFAAIVIALQRGGVRGRRSCRLVRPRGGAGRRPVAAAGRSVHARLCITGRGDPDARPIRRRSTRWSSGNTPASIWE